MVLSSFIIVFVILYPPWPLLQLLPDTGGRNPSSSSSSSSLSPSSSFSPSPSLPLTAASHHHHHPRRRRPLSSPSSPHLFPSVERRRKQVCVYIVRRQAPVNHHRHHGRARVWLSLAVIIVIMVCRWGARHRPSSLSSWRIAPYAFHTPRAPPFPVEGGLDARERYELRTAPTPVDVVASALCFDVGVDVSVVVPALHCHREQRQTIGPGERDDFVVCARSAEVDGDVNVGRCSVIIFELRY